MVHLLSSKISIKQSLRMLNLYQVVLSPDPKGGDICKIPTWIYPLALWHTHKTTQQLIDEVNKI